MADRISSTRDKLLAEDKRSTAARYRQLAADAHNVEAAFAHNRLADKLEADADILDPRL